MSTMVQVYSPHTEEVDAEGLLQPRSEIPFQIKQLPQPPQQKKSYKKKLLLLAGAVIFYSYLKQKYFTMHTYPTPTKAFKKQ